MCNGNDLSKYVFNVTCVTVKTDFNANKTCINQRAFNLEFKCQSLDIL